ncbi:NADH:flavorubredoxin oxidoreductase [Vibrio sp. UCD-FRSSP16_10]|uniref:NADH:flavorubredoxin reductase NorW n=1 Tax=unclassified Vibrio TaxID=2614977 RepID=UPI000800F220|nr:MULTISPECIES: NADH:flavorubredoxin reductase NorW [unclassified Vibrio]OBT13880.1 NADH:flavorubredoxin oxidoreductase [Vibrio sp. UCD-FRSSP16_30]OBT22761.1 NADH:flavorubredoxin oxidoreductase [Vibrio sp. UCD-FRSSP16_10]
MNPITIIGSGFAAYQLVKTIRRMNAEVPIRIITADKGHDYNKPDLSHVVSKQQTAEDLITSKADDFVQQHNIELCAEHLVSEINPQLKVVVANGKNYEYSSLVMATGAKPFMPPIEGLKESAPITLNSLQEFEEFRDRLTSAKSILVIGGGLIGVEISMDLALSDKKVTVVEAAPRLMANQLPEFIGLKLDQGMQKLNVDVKLGQGVKQVAKTDTGFMVTLAHGDVVYVDEVLVCTGLIPNTVLASEAGISTNRGICVDDAMQTSCEDIYALGDCAEQNGQVRAYLQPTVISASSLAKTLLGERTSVVLPNMMVKVKTPSYPIQLGGTTTDSVVARWNLDIHADGIVAKAYNDDDTMIGFIATEDKTKQAFPLLRELSTQ